MRRFSAASIANSLYNPCRCLRDDPADLFKSIPVRRRLSAGDAVAYFQLFNCFAFGPRQAGDAHGPKLNLLKRRNPSHFSLGWRWRAQFQRGPIPRERWIFWFRRCRSGKATGRPCRRAAASGGFEGHGGCVGGVRSRVRWARSVPRAGLSPVCSGPIVSGCCYSDRYRTHQSIECVMPSLRQDLGRIAGHDFQRRGWRAARERTMSMLIGPQTRRSCGRY